MFSPTMPDKHLSIYLNDHSGGSKFGVDLAMRIAKSHEGTQTGLTFSYIAREIEQDRETLRILMSELGIRTTVVKRVVAATADKAARLKLNGEIIGRSPLSSLIEMETLSIGVEGKRLLWKALLSASVDVDGIDYEELIRRAESQRQRIEAERLKAAAQAIAPHGAAAPSRNGRTPAGVTSP
jgi:hypothetical protein